MKSFHNLLVDNWQFRLIVCSLNETYAKLRCDITLIPKVCAVTDGERSVGVVTVAGGGMGDASGGIVVREEGEGY